MTVQNKILSNKKKSDLTIKVSQLMGKVSMKFITLLNQLELPQVTRKIDPTVDANP